MESWTIYMRPLLGAGLRNMPMPWDRKTPQVLYWQEIMLMKEIYILHFTLEGKGYFIGKKKKKKNQKCPKETWPLSHQLFFLNPLQNPQFKILIHNDSLSLNLTCPLPHLCPLMALSNIFFRNLSQIPLTFFAYDLLLIFFIYSCNGAWNVFSKLPKLKILWSQWLSLSKSHMSTPSSLSTNGSLSNVFLESSLKFLLLSLRIFLSTFF